MQSAKDLRMQNCYYPVEVYVKYDNIDISIQHMITFNNLECFKIMQKKLYTVLSNGCSRWIVCKGNPTSVTQLGPFQLLGHLCVNHGYPLGAGPAFCICSLAQKPAKSSQSMYPLGALAWPKCPACPQFSHGMKDLPGLIKID